MMKSNECPYSIHHLPETDRPRERLMRFGVEALSTAELIAVILGSGTKASPVLQLSQALVAKFGSLEKLSEATVQELCEMKGIGKAKAIQLRAAFHLGLRISRQSIGSRERIEHPSHIYNLVKDLFQGEKREVFMSVMLDAKGHLITHEVISIGTLTETPVHPREVFYPAIRHKAVSIILIHNHPSNDLTPSKQDLELTRKLIAVGETMGIPIRDHLIIGDHGYHSMRQSGFSFSRGVSG